MSLGRPDALTVGAEPVATGQSLTAPLRGRLVWYVLLMTASLSLSAISGVVFAWAMSPESLGYYSLASVVVAYGSFLQLGLLSGLGRELPVLLGGGQHERARHLMTTATNLLGVLCVSAFLGYVGVIASIPVPNPDYRLALALGGLWTVSSLLVQVPVIRLRSARNLLAFPVVLLVQRAVGVTVGAAAARHAGFGGLLGVLVAVDLLTFLSLGSFRWVRPVRALLSAEMVSLAAVGFPIMLGSFIQSTQLTLDRVFLIGASSPRQLGLYQLAATPLALGLALSSIVNQYLGPKVLHDFGAGGTLRGALRECLKTTVVLTGLMLAAAPLVFPLADFAVTRWLPHYRDALPAFRILYVGSIFLATNTAGLVLDAARRPAWYTRALVPSVAVSLGLFAAVSRQTTDLAAYALVTVVGLALNFAVRFWLAFVCVNRLEPSQ